MQWHMELRSVGCPCLCVVEAKYPKTGGRLHEEEQKLLLLPQLPALDDSGLIKMDDLEVDKLDITTPPTDVPTSDVPAITIPRSVATAIAALPVQQTTAV